MRGDGGQEVVRSAVVQEPDPLSEAPERSSAELVAAGIALLDVVVQSCSHVMNGEVAEKPRGDVFEARRDPRPTNHRLAGHHLRAMTRGTSDVAEYGFTVDHRHQRRAG